MRSSAWRVGLAVALCVGIVWINRPDESTAFPDLRSGYLAVWCATALALALASGVRAPSLTLGLTVLLGALAGIALAMWLVDDPWAAWSAWLLAPLSLGVGGHIIEALRGAQTPLVDAMSRVERDRL